MGYTHYISTKRAATSAEMEQIVNCFSLILKSQNTILDINSTASEAIWFNGRGDDAHETFIFDGGEHTDFCKTAMKPYDTAVVATLMAIKVAMGEGVSICSDGDLEDWQAGIDLFHSVIDCTIAANFDGNGDFKTSNMGES